MKYLSDPLYDPAFKFYPGGYLAEEYMQGKEFSVEGVSSCGEHHFFGITEKWINHENFIEVQHGFKANISDITKATILTMATQALNSIKWRFGGFHIEIMLTSNGARIVEINGRLGGDYIGSDLIEISTGIDPICLNYSAVCGKEILLKSKYNKGGCVSFLVANKSGVFKSLLRQEEARKISGMCDIKLEADFGSKATSSRETPGNYRLAAIISEGDSLDDAINTAAVAKNMLRIVIE